MNDDIFYDDDDDVDDDEVSDDIHTFDNVADQLRHNDLKMLDARRKIERLLELKRLKELNEDIDWMDLE